MHLFIRMCIHYVIHLLSLTHSHLLTLSLFLSIFLYPNFSVTLSYYNLSLILPYSTLIHFPHHINHNIITDLKEYGLTWRKLFFLINSCNFPRILVKSHRSWRIEALRIVFDFIMIQKLVRIGLYWSYFKPLLLSFIMHIMIWWYYMGISLITFFSTEVAISLFLSIPFYFYNRSFFFFL